MKTAFLGMIQSGKSALLSAVSGRPFDANPTVAIEEAVVPVPDERLDWLTGLYQPKKTVHATIDCLDLPGLSFADESGRSAARRLFGQIRTVDLFVIVLRAFGPGANPAKEWADLRTELILADLELVTTRIERLEKQIHKPSKTQAQDKAELALQKKLAETLEAEQPVSAAIQSEDEVALIKSLGLLTLRPAMVVVNIGEDQLGESVDTSFLEEGTPVVALCAEIEAELAQLDESSRQEFMGDYGLTEPASARFVQTVYESLGLISFLTVGKDEVRAWPIRRGTTALDAAGKIHSDIKRGFIRAETIAYDDMKTCGSEKDCKAAGKVRLEGKTYVVHDGDIINFRFNV